MPIYEYKCLQCGLHIEKRQSVSDEPLTTCEKCHGTLEKQWSLSGFQFKGAGWYVTDYAGKKIRPGRINHKDRNCIKEFRRQDIASERKSEGKRFYTDKRMRTGCRKIVYLILCTLILAAIIPAQSRRNARGNDVEGTILTVTAARDDKKTDPIKIENLYLYENGIEQKIKNFSFDPSPAKIVILVDNSQTLQTSVELMKKAAMEFAYEIFEGDQLFTIAYDEKPEIIQEWTDDAKKMETSLATFRKKGNPYLFDALDVSLREILLPLMPGTRKTAVVVISDGLDRGSKTSFDKVLSELQNQNVTVYALQIPDRTGGAYRRDQPKAPAVINQLVEGTGGKVFPFEEAQTAAKAICDELKKSRYLLSYLPTNTSSFDARKIFLLGDEGISVRTKTMHPPNVK